MLSALDERLLACIQQQVHFVPGQAFACRFTFPNKVAFVSLFNIKNLLRNTDSKPQTFIFPEDPAVTAGIIIRGLCYAVKMASKLAQQRDVGAQFGGYPYTDWQLPLLRAPYMVTSQIPYSAASIRKSIHHIAAAKLLVTPSIPSPSTSLTLDKDVSFEKFVKEQEELTLKRLTKYPFVQLSLSKFQIVQSEAFVNITGSKLNIALVTTVKQVEQIDSQSQPALQLNPGALQVSPNIIFQYLAASARKILGDIEVLIPFSTALSPWDIIST